MFSSLVVLASVLAVVSAGLYTHDESHQKYVWDSFKKDFGRRYDTMEEEMSRFGNFITNLKIADARNEKEKLAGGSAVHGITKFSDMSQEEFKLQFLKSDKSMKLGGEVFEVKEPPKANAGLVDWSGIFTTPIKNQGYCGSCWAFSAAEQIESDAIRTLGVSYLLSPEQITQCDRTSFGCGGGWTEHAYNYVNRAGGITTEAIYPYTSSDGTTGTCHDNSAQAVITVSGYSTISGESQMASYVQNTGPISVCLDANNFNSYTGGVMAACGQQVDHCVQAVGVDVGNYWVVRNSWGEGWGEGGRIRLAYGSNTCNIAYDPTFVTVGRK